MTSFDLILEQLDRIESIVVETHTVAVATHETVLDLQVELQRLSGLPSELRLLMQEVLNRISQVGMEKGEGMPSRIGRKSAGMFYARLRNARTGHTRH